MFSHIYVLYWLCDYVYTDQVCHKHDYFAKVNVKHSIGVNIGAVTIIMLY